MATNPLIGADGKTAQVYEGNDWRLKHTSLLTFSEPLRLNNVQISIYK